MEPGGLYANLGAEASGGSGVQGNGSGCGLAGVPDPDMVGACLKVKVVA